MVVSRRQWALALIAAVGLHLLAGVLVWLIQSAPSPPRQAPRGVMVSLDALDVGSQPSQPATPAPIEAATVPQAIAPAPAQPAGPIMPAAPAPVVPVGPEPADPTDTPALGTVRSDSGVAIPVAEPVTIRSVDTVETIPPKTQVTARAPEPIADAGNGANGTSESATVAYIDRLRAWLARHKYYPQQARRARAEGTVRLYIAVSRDGQVLSASIAESSGNPALDRAARDMVRRAEPLPTMSDDMLRTRLELIVPVRFTLD